MTDVHEEAQLSLAHLLGMDMFLDAQTVFLFPAATNNVLREHGADDEQVETVGPCRTVPGTVDDDRELPV